MPLHRGGSGRSKDRHQLHLALLTAYCSSVTKTHKTSSTCRSYASKVAGLWEQAYGVPLWPDSMFKDIKPYMDGLFKIKMFVAEKREGLNAPDTLVLCQTVTAWAKANRRIMARGHHVWGGHFAAATIASFQFANGEVFRFGEATCPAGKDFDIAYGLTQGDVSIVPGKPGQPDVMKIKPNKFKVRNSHSSEYITGEIRPDDPLNWPTAIQHMMMLDPIHSQEERLRTPLFRDTRHLSWDKVRGGFPPGTAKEGGGDSLPYRTMLKILRELIQAESGRDKWFEGRPGPFGLHSFRIGSTLPPSPPPFTHQFHYVPLVQGCWGQTYNQF